MLLIRPKQNTPILGVNPLSSYKMALKQQLNRQQQKKKRKKGKKRHVELGHLSALGWAMLNLPSARHETNTAQLEAEEES